MSVAVFILCFIGSIYFGLSSSTVEIKVHGRKDLNVTNAVIITTALYIFACVALAVIGVLALKYL